MNTLQNIVAGEAILTDTFSNDLFAVTTDVESIFSLGENNQISELNSSDVLFANPEDNLLVGFNESNVLEGASFESSDLLQGGNESNILASEIITNQFTVNADSNPGLDFPAGIDTTAMSILTIEELQGRQLNVFETDDSTAFVDRGVPENETNSLATSTPVENFVFEAENSEVSGAVEKQVASQASKGGVIQNPIWKEWEGQATYNFTPRVGGEYYVWLRVSASTEREIGENYENFDYRLPYNVSLAAANNGETTPAENIAENSTIIPSRFYTQSDPVGERNNNLYWIRVTNEVMEEYSSAEEALNAPGDDAFKFNLAAGEEAQLALISDRGPRYQPVQIDKVFITSSPTQTPMGQQSNQTTFDVRGAGFGDSTATDLSLQADTIPAALNYHDNFLQENEDESYSKSSSFIWKQTLFPTAESSQIAENIGRFASEDGIDDAHLSVWKRSETEDFRYANRAELNGEYGSGGFGTENWYAFSTFIDDWDKSEKSEDIIAQWRLEPDPLDAGASEEDKNDNGRMPPPLAFAVDTRPGVNGGEPQAVLNIVTQSNDDEVWFESSISRETLYSEPLQEDEWTDWVVHTKWSDQDGDALIEIWKDGNKLELGAGDNKTEEWRKGNIWNQTENGLEFKLGIYHTEGNAVDERQIYHDEVRVASGIVGFDEITNNNRRIDEPTITPAIPILSNPSNGTFENDDTWSLSGGGLESFNIVGKKARIAVKPGSTDPANAVIKTNAFDFPDIGEKKIYRVQFDARSINNLGQPIRALIRYDNIEDRTSPSLNKIDRYDFYTDIKNKRYVIDLPYNNPNPPSNIQLEFQIGGLSDRTALIEIDNVRVDQIGVTR